MKITHHHELRTPVDLDCSEPKLTDQSFKNACDINIIMANYAKTGLLPQTTSIPAKYVDNTQVPTLEESFEIVNRALDAFYTLPPDIRKLMDNDPAKLEDFIQNPDNKDMLLKNGIIIEQKPIPKTEIQELTEEIRKFNTQQPKPAVT